MSPRKLIRTVRFHELGGPEVLTIDSLASPSLQATTDRAFKGHVFCATKKGANSPLSTLCFS